MKKFHLYMVVFTLCLLTSSLIGCGKTAQPQSGGFGNFPQFNPDGGNNPFSAQVFFNLFGLGTFPNRITIEGSFAYITNSGSDSVQRINLVSGAVDNPFVTLPSFSNPWELLVNGTIGYISNFISDTVSIVNLQTGAVIGSISANPNGTLNDPEGLDIAANGLIFVANADFDPTFAQGPGFVTVIDSATNQIVNQIPTTQKNPQFVYTVGNTVYVVNSGEGFFDAGGCGCFAPLTDGGVDVIDATTAATATAVDSNIPIALDPSHPLRGFPGSFAMGPSSNFAYLGSNSGIMYKIDLVSESLLRGNSNPIFVTPSSTDNLVNVKIDNQGVGYVLSFNEDLTYLFDFSNDQVITPALSLDSDVNNLEGPLDLAFLNSGVFQDAYILMSVSEQLSAIITN